MPMVKVLLRSAEACKEVVCERPYKGETIEDDNVEMLVADIRIETGSTILTADITYLEQMSDYDLHCTHGWSTHKEYQDRNL